MIDVFMVCVTAIATIVVVGIPFAILGATEAVRRRTLIAKVDAATAAISRATESTERATVKVQQVRADISGVYPHRPELRP